MDGPVNTELDELFLTVTTDGIAYYSTFAPDRSVTIFRKDLHDPMAPAVAQYFLNDTARLTNPAIAPDGSYLILSSGNISGFGSADLYVCFPTDRQNVWSAPVNLGPKVNSAFTEFAPGISPDGQWLFFTSERPGMVASTPEGQRPPGDLYVIRLEIFDQRAEVGGPYRELTLSLARKICGQPQRKLRQ